MAIAAIQVRNGTCNPITLPAPYQGILAPGQGQLLLTTKNAFLAACGGAQGAYGLDVIDQTGVADSVLLTALAQPGAGVFQAVRGVATSNVAISGPGASVGGVSPSASASPDERRFLLTNQSTTAQNGIWIWNGASVAMTRAADMAEGAVVKAGALVSVRDGTSADTVWQVTNSAEVVIGTDSLTAAVVTSTASDVLTDANLSDTLPEAGTLEGTAGTSGDVSRADHAHPGLTVQRVTTQIEYTDLTDTAGLTKDVPLTAMPVDGLILGVAIEVVTPFAGSGVADLSVDILAGAVLGTVEVDGSAGFQPSASGTSIPGVSLAGPSPDITFTAVGANLDQLTAGELYVHFYYVPVVTAVP